MVEVSAFEIIVYTFRLSIKYDPDSYVLRAIDEDGKLVGVYEIGDYEHVLKALSDFVDVLAETRED